MIKWQLESNDGVIQHWINLVPGNGLTDAFVKPFNVLTHLLSSTLIGYSFSNKSIFYGNVIQITKLSSCLKMFIKWHASDLYKSISHQLVNINSPIHSIVLSALRRSGMRTCLVWRFRSGFFGKFITTSWKFLSRRVVFKRRLYLITGRFSQNRRVVHPHRMNDKAIFVLYLYC